VGFLAPFCSAEARWCSIVGRGPNDSLYYPPIARAAWVHGTVLSRILYWPTGKVKDLEPISGPVMLSNAMGEQMKGWTIRTDASGNELCQTLVIADFRLHDPPYPTKDGPAVILQPSVLRLSVEAEGLIISDPAAYLDRNLLHRVGYFLKRTISRIFAPGS
jgi:hypothetical protein